MPIVEYQVFHFEYWIESRVVENWKIYYLMMYFDFENKIFYKNDIFHQLVHYILECNFTQNPRIEEKYKNSQIFLVLIFDKTQNS